MKVQSCVMALVASQVNLAHSNPVKPEGNGIYAGLSDDFRFPDNRTFREVRAYANYDCTYPADPTTMYDLFEVAKARAEAGHRDPYSDPGHEIDGHVYACDQCHAGGFEGGGYSWFCAEEDELGYVKFIRANYNNDCSKFTGGMSDLGLSPERVGLEHGQIVQAECTASGGSDGSKGDGAIRCYYPGKHHASNLPCAGEGQDPNRPKRDCCLGLINKYQSTSLITCELQENIGCSKQQPADNEIEKLSVYYRWIDTEVSSTLTV